MHNRVPAGRVEAPGVHAQGNFNRSSLLNQRIALNVIVAMRTPQLALRKHFEPRLHRCAAFHI